MAKHDLAKVQASLDATRLAVARQFAGVHLERFVNSLLLSKQNKGEKIENSSILLSFARVPVV